MAKQPNTNAPTAPPPPPPELTEAERRQQEEARLKQIEQERLEADRKAVLAKQQELDRKKAQEEAATKKADVGEELAALLRNATSEFGRSIKGNLKEVAAYTNARLAHLRAAAAANEPGLDKALRAERDSIMLMTAGVTVKSADAFDQRLFGLVEGALSIALAAI
jgi:hypothetical protein